MTTVAIYTLNCDGLPAFDDDCERWVGEEISLANARRTARAAGWSVARERDLCPHCATRLGVSAPHAPRRVRSTATMVPIHEVAVNPGRLG